ncbi:MAG TPA: glucan biosynthesis protein D [Caulobacteraceae bacterium]|jgi:glucans biosynthesis protein|nr:glucan biosynthesis protein D [Caulobacteraceae bacterium]
MPFTLSRRNVLAGALSGTIAHWAGSAAAAAAPGPLSLGPPRPFGFDGLKRQAQALARTPQAPRPVLDADILDAIDYDAYGQIAYRPELTLWNSAPGAQPVRLFPLGRYFKEPVAIHLLERGQARQVLYSPDLFETPAGHPLRRLKQGGFAGFRLMSPGGRSDWLAFLGASYFRSSDPFDQYGASARGLAINSGGPAAEEFPRFSAFWLEQDGHGGLTVYALMESPSVVGAFSFGNRRGPAGAVQRIETALYFRRPVETLGLAPLTSMFWYGANSNGPRPDWRPQVHDSDGLAIWTGADERIWRPLNDPPRATRNSFLDHRPKGFGLAQRDRSFEDYQDDSVFYEKRPTLWVEPLTDWGAGAVGLVELPTVGETDDNVVAFWTPAQKIQAGSTLDAAYNLHWVAEDPPAADGARVVSTRIGPGGRPGLAPRPGARKFVIDLAGPALEGLTRASGVRAIVTASRGHVDNVSAYPVVGTHRWRLMFDLSDVGGQTADLRAYLDRNGQALSESWLYQAFP